MNDPFELTEADDGPAAPDGPAPSERWLEGLNDAQRDAVGAVDGPVLVLAGAGTGKTRVLTTRLAHILANRPVRPYQLLAVTFTNKAAREMKERVQALLAHPAEGWWIGTFHSLGARILRQHAEMVGLSRDFTILDADDQVRLIKQLAEPLNIDEKRWPARALNGVIQRWKDRGVTPEKVPADEADAIDGKAVALYQAYQERLRTLNAADFGDLLMHCLSLFTAAPDILARYQDQFRYILVDEYQDTNVSQYLWLRLLAQKHRNICCVGDDDQSIYSWRGAEVGNILRFENDFPGATVVRLERNYRSTGHILAAASGLIANNEDRLGKTLWTEDDHGEKVTVTAVWDGEEEARAVCSEIENLHRKGARLGEVAVLVRAGFQTREFEERLLSLGVPYRVVGGARFYERQEIRDAVAYLRVIAQPADDLAFERIVNVPKRGLGKASMQMVHALARAEAIPLTAAARRLLESEELRPKARTVLGGLLDDFERWRALAAGTSPSDLCETVLDESGYGEMWRLDKAPDSQGRVDNLKELVAALEEFETLGEFLEHISLVMETTQDAGTDMVTLMTLHGAKGLEFDHVFLPGWEEGLFPHQRALDESGLKGLEEERRLAYVGLTRARRKAWVLHASNRRIYNKWQSSLPSRFVEELPDPHVEREGHGALFAATRAEGRGELAPGLGYRERARRRVGEGDPAIIGGGAEQRYAAGARVFHLKFGTGTVYAADGDKLVIDFDRAGRKKVVDSFVEPA